MVKVKPGPLLTNCALVCFCTVCVVEHFRTFGGVHGVYVSNLYCSYANLKYERP